MMRLLSMFDFFTPAAAIIGSLKRDPTLLSDNSYTFMVSAGGDWDGAMVAALLRDYNIETWSHFYDPEKNEYWLSVYLDDAGVAEWLLNDSGVPLAERCQGAPI